MWERDRQTTKRETTKRWDASGDVTPIFQERNTMPEWVYFLLAVFIGCVYFLIPNDDED